MVVNIKLEFADGQDLKRMVVLLWEIECPKKEVKCVGCLYHESCLKLRQITNELESVDIYEE